MCFVPNFKNQACTLKLHNLRHSALQKPQLQMVVVESDDIPMGKYINHQTHMKAIVITPTTLRIFQQNQLIRKEEEEEVEPQSYLRFVCLFLRLSKHNATFYRTLLLLSFDKRNIHKLCMGSTLAWSQKSSWGSNLTSQWEAN